MLTYKCLNNQFLESSGYSLFPIQENNIELIRKWRNKQIKFLRQQKIITQDEQKEYFSSLIFSQYQSSRPSEILMGLYYKDTLIGYGGLVHIGWQDKKAEVSFLLNPTRMKDLNTYKRDFSNYLFLIKKLAKEELNLHKIFSETYTFRKYHINLLEQANFIKEKFIKDRTYKEGISIDSVIHGIVFNKNGLN